MSQSFHWPALLLSAQMEEDVGPVILINKFNIKPEDVDQLLKAWTADAKYFKQLSPQSLFLYSCCQPLYLLLKFNYVPD